MNGILQKILIFVFVIFYMNVNVHSQNIQNYNYICKINGYLPVSFSLFIQDSTVSGECNLKYLGVKHKLKGLLYASGNINLITVNKKGKIICHYNGEIEGNHFYGVWVGDNPKEVKTFKTILEPNRSNIKKINNK